MKVWRKLRHIVMRVEDAPVVDPAAPPPVKRLVRMGLDVPHAWPPMTVDAPPPPMPRCTRLGDE